jgi:cardiolipin synthase
MAIYGARSELILTTPYFVPDEALLTALSTAARRGVEVSLIVPAKIDSKLAQYASQPHKGALLEAGVKIYEFEGGLLHTKSVTIDGVRSLFGSLNLDPRSMVLNFEITLAVYDQSFTEALRTLQLSYVEKSKAMNLVAWQDRAPAKRFLEDAARLLSPLL